MCYCEPPKAFRQDNRKARKKHKCCECFSIINVGEVYEYSSGVWDYPASFKTCMSCVDVRRTADDIYDCTPCFGELREVIEGNSLCSDYGLKEFAKDTDTDIEKLNKLFRNGEQQ